MIQKKRENATNNLNKQISNLKKKRTELTEKATNNLNIQISNLEKKRSKLTEKATNNLNVQIYRRWCFAKNITVYEPW